MNELIEKCQQSAWFLVSDLEAAYAKATSAGGLEGRNHGDNAMVACLADRMEAARKLHSDLLRL